MLTFKGYIQIPVAMHRTIHVLTLKCALHIHTQLLNIFEPNFGIFLHYRSNIQKHTEQHVHVLLRPKFPHKLLHKLRYENGHDNTRPLLLLVG